MKTVYIERSAGSGRGGDWTESLDLDGAQRLVVGTGPGSFAGIRSALAFAQGYALGRPCEVLGLPSACAVAAQVFAAAGTVPLAVVGDSRRGMAWVAIFDGFEQKGAVFQVSQAELKGTVPADCRVVTPDAERIGDLLRDAFGARYLGGEVPTAEGLRRFAEACPAALKPEPLPIYLNPAVR